jgi:hypothetical protein
MTVRFGIVGILGILDYDTYSTNMGIVPHEIDKFFTVQRKVLLMAKQRLGRS